MAEKKKKGFACMTPERVREIGRMGGRSAHAKGVAHQFTSDEAREAGKKGGKAPHVRRGKAPRAKEEAASGDQG